MSTKESTPAGDAPEIRIAELQSALAAERSRAERMAERLKSVEQQCAELTSLHVAGSRLREVANYDAVLEVIQEIIINLVGAEELAVFEVRDTNEVRLLASTGVAASTLHKLESSAAFAEQLRSRAPFITSGSTDPEQPTVCIPLKSGARVIGGIAIFRLLPQKLAGLQDIDHDLFALLSEHAGRALMCMRVHPDDSE
jgi:hypothetical protein